MKTGIYEKIQKIIEECGCLPQNFEPEERQYAANKLRFAPGALEGILGHHASGESDKSDFLETLIKYINMTEKDAMEHFENELADDFSTALKGQGILKDIYDNRNGLLASKVFGMAVYFATNGTKVETVKLGLCLLRLFDVSGNEEICNTLEILGNCEEFTEYVIDNTASWNKEKQQDLYFKLAQKLYGWGKINLVEMLECNDNTKEMWEKLLKMECL